MCFGDKKAGSEIGPSNHDRSSAEMDLCSPLCYCNCCSSQAVPSDSFVSCFLFYNTRVADAQRIRMVTSAYNSIWQPPRVA